MASAPPPPRAPSPVRKIASTVRDSKAPAIARAAAIMRLLGRSDRPLGVQAIAKELGLVPSTCLYVLRALVEEELVAFDLETKRYGLDAGVLALARQWLRRSQFPDLCQPALDALARDYHVTLMGVQLFGLEHMIVVAQAQSLQDFQLSAHVGSRFPALISATGRCVAAFGDHPAEALRARFNLLRWDNAPDFDQWMREVAQARAQGYAIDEGNYMAGVTVLAAPVRSSRDGRLSHALVAVGMSSMMRRNGMEALAAALVEAARTVSERLGAEAAPR